MEGIISTVSATEIRSIALTLLERGLVAAIFPDSQAERREPPVLLRYQSEGERAAAIRLFLSQATDQHPPAQTMADRIEKLLREVLDGQDAKVAIDNLKAVQKFLNERRNGPQDSAGGCLTVESGASAGVQLFRWRHEYLTGIANCLDREIEHLRFVAAVMQTCLDYRRRRELSLDPVDELAVEHACHLVDRGVRLPRWIEPLRKSAERKHQTYLSFADPGDGHLKVTVRDSTLLDGTIVHIEWIDRDNVNRKDLVEAYRLSSPGRAARVRLHVGGETPCSSFIGRPVFEARELGQAMDGKQFEMSLLKAAHTTAGACSAMFAHGIIDCKVAMDGMTASQAVAFMRAVAGNVVRDPDTQWLSAAFNVNTSILDDRHGELRRKVVTRPFEIAKLGIDLVKQGKFDKVAWDGASDQQPSKPIIGQLSHSELLELVHDAHQFNLETYISAGMVAGHMRDAVYLGVGGVGIGTSLHHIADERTKEIGEIEPARVREALKVRNDAAADDAGKAARKMAELDWLWCQTGNMDAALDELRGKLYVELLKFHTGWDEMQRRLAGIDATEKHGALSAAEADERAKLRKELADYGREMPQLRSILQEIEKSETPSRQRSKAFDSAPDTSTLPLEIRRKAIYKRAERIVAAHRDGGKPVGPIQPDENTLAKIEWHLKNGDMEGLRQIIDRLDESVVWESLLD